jgi:imidazole glycerol-phosphate synthase subunit HisH
VSAASTRAAPRVTIVDTGSGNLRSVERALAAAGAQATVTTDPEAVAAADKIVVPGQGAFGGCVAGLDHAGGALRQAVLEAIGAGKPYLGICLGLQILFDSSDEDPSCRGLGVIPGRVTRFVVPAPLKVPHIGWNEVRRGPASGAAAAALGDTSDGTYFYFVHSYYPVPDDARDVALTSDYGAQFCAAVARDNVFACQFHPEKSQAAGLGLLGRFVASG